MKSATRTKPDPRLISTAEAAELIGVSESAIRKRRSGTGDLTHVRGFGRRRFLIRAEVEALIEQKIETAKAAHRRMFRLIKKSSS